MSMNEVNKGGRPKEEPTNVRSVRLPIRVGSWYIRHRKAVVQSMNTFKH